LKNISKYRNKEMDKKTQKKLKLIKKLRKSLKRVCRCNVDRCTPRSDYGDPARSYAIDIAICALRKAVTNSELREEIWNIIKKSSYYGDPHGNRGIECNGWSSESETEESEEEKEESEEEM